MPALALWGGSTNLINWGPGLLFAGATCLLLSAKDRCRPIEGRLHTACFLALLGLLFIRARYSADISSAANNSALLGLAACGLLIGRFADDMKSRALFFGLSVAIILNFTCSLIQIKNPGWNLIYPQRSAGFPSGLFAHYSYSAAFCLGSAGLLTSSGMRERGWFKVVLIGGAICALATIPISLSRGGNLALAIMIAVAIFLLLARAFAKSKSVLGIWLPSLILLAMILILATSVVPMIGRNKGSGGFYADGVRIDLWNAATQISTNHPWLGGGPGSFAWESFRVMDGLTREPGMVHNEALQMAVEFGYPALVFLAALIAIPLALRFSRFVNKTDDSFKVWPAVGLVAMLIQSNFESIFHSAPGAFIAALILGNISRGMWEMKKVDSAANAMAAGIPDLSPTIKAHVNDYLAGDAEAVSRLTALLLRSQDKQLRKSADDLVFWKKTQNEEALRKAMVQLGISALEKHGYLPASDHSPAGKNVSKTGPLVWRVLGKGALAALALFIAFRGTRLSQALAEAWTPFYYPQSLTASNRFERLISLAEKQPGLGIDRMVLSAARNCILSYDTLEDRENWASTHRTRIQCAIPGWKTDPGAALLIAEITGWAGDVHSALEYYNRAISLQGNNDSLFLAHSFKGQYLYELSLSSGVAGDIPQQKYFAKQAIECFNKAAEALGSQQRKLDPYFGRMLRECETYGKKDM